jgi:hypothetical protein
LGWTTVRATHQENQKEFFAFVQRVAPTIGIKNSREYFALGCFHNPFHGPASNFIAVTSGAIDPLLDTYFHLGKHPGNDIFCRMQLDVWVKRLVALEQDLDQLQRPSWGHIPESRRGLVRRRGYKMASNSLVHD